MDGETKEMVPVHPPLRDELCECLDGLDVNSGEVSLRGWQITDGDLVSVVPRVCTFRNLTMLHLTENQIVDVAPLATLVNLTSLGLNENQIVDVAPLVTLVHLTELLLDGNHIVDVAPLATLVNLT